MARCRSSCHWTTWLSANLASVKFCYCVFPPLGSTESFLIVGMRSLLAPISSTCNSLTVCISCCGVPVSGSRAEGPSRENIAASRVLLQVWKKRKFQRGEATSSQPSQVTVESSETVESKEQRVSDRIDLPLELTSESRGSCSEGTATTEVAQATSPVSDMSCLLLGTPWW